MAKIKHTPITWRYDDEECYIRNEEGIVIDVRTMPLKNNKETACFICLACNNHDALIKALEAWHLYDSESGDKHPCPDYTLKVQYRDNARKLTEAVLAQIEREEK